MEHQPVERGQARPVYAALPGGLWLQSQAASAHGIAHGLGQPPVGIASANQFFWGAPAPQDTMRDKLGQNKQFEKLPLIPKRIGFAHLIPHIFMAPLCFTAVFYAWSFVDRIYYYYVPFLVSGFFLATSAFFVLYNSIRNKHSGWLVYAAGSLFVANCLGFYQGNANFGLVNDYVTVKGMATYVNVNPSEENGDGFADAGEAYFEFGSRIDTTRVMAFKNTDLFCVAPILMKVEDGEEDPKGEDAVFAEDHVGASGTVDWWAVGRNCCNPSGDGFSCGPSPLTLARSGLRELSAEDRQFYQFAVHQWTSKYKIPARHPLFFHWVVDPLGTVNGYMLQAELAYHSQCQLSVVASLALLVFARISIDGFGA